MRTITLMAVTSSTETLMFDGFVDTQTEVMGQIIEIFDVSNYNAVVCLNNYGISANLQVVNVDTSMVVYSETISLIQDHITDWWDYFFSPNYIGRDLVWYFPKLTNATATITIDNPGDIAKCGMCLQGMSEDAGKTQWGSRLGISDYSVVATNSFGLTYLSVGAWAKRINADVTVPNTGIDKVFNTVVANRAAVSVYDFNNYDFTDTGTSMNGISAYIVVGFLESFEPSIASPLQNVVGMEIRGIR